MFEVGKRYWARSGDYSIKVRVERRGKRKVTFLTTARDAVHMGVKPRFSKIVDLVDVPTIDGRVREAVFRLGDKHPACDWYITDEEVGGRS